MLSWNKSFSLTTCPPSRLVKHFMLSSQWKKSCCFTSITNVRGLWRLPPLKTPEDNTAVNIVCPSVIRVKTGLSCVIDRLESCALCIVFIFGEQGFTTDAQKNMSVGKKKTVKLYFLISLILVLAPWETPVTEPLQLVGKYIVAPCGRVQYDNISHASRTRLPVNMFKTSSTMWLLINSFQTWRSHILHYNLCIYWKLIKLSCIRWKVPFLPTEPELFTHSECWMLNAHSLYWWLNSVALEGVLSLCTSPPV